LFFCDFNSAFSVNDLQSEMIKQYSGLLVQSFKLRAGLLVAKAKPRLVLF